MRRFITAAFGLFAALTLGLTPAFAVENTWDPAVQVSATVQSSPAKVTLTWPQDTNGVPSSYTIFRKDPTSTNWGSGTTISGSSTSYTDANVAVGNAYEYRIVKAANGYTGYGYITAGVDAPLVDSRGKVVLVVDNTFTSSLASELARLEQDLRGDGWVVVRRDVSRTDSVQSVKAVIKSVYDSDPANVKAVFLFGHVPVPYSGQLNPDGHPDHLGAWPADVFYGDMDGNWTDNSVNYTQTINTNREDAARISNVPGDGKFDQTQIPSSVELAVGRVDLSRMPGRPSWGAPATLPSELELTRKYLNKDHNFRHRILNTQRRAILGDYFGLRGGEAFAASGYRSFAPLVGANNIRNLNIEFNDQKGNWIPQAKANDYLLAYGCGAGGYDAMNGLGSGLYNGANTEEMVRENVRGIFNMLFGSWLGDWDVEDNFLRSPLATDYGLTSVWSGRPHWFMHSLGLGDTIGQVTRLNQNNTGLYQTIINSGQNRIHIALMGDPTLRIHPVVPAANLNGSVSGSTVALSWSGSNDSNIVGYHVYRASSSNGNYTRLTSSPVTGTSFSDSNATAGATYMVRAIKLETAASGTYYNAAQGVFYTVGGTNVPTAPATDSTAPTVSIASPSAGASVSGTVNVTANASDNVGVTAVQFKLDGANLGSEDTGSPFSTSLNTTTLSNGTHTLTAVARDAAGNMASANTVSINVNNTTTASSGGTSSGSTSGSTTTPTTGTTEGTINAALTTAGSVVWLDDALPAGAGGIGASAGDAWNWVTSPVFSGSKAHQTNVVSGQHEHWFGWSNNNLPVAAGEVLYTYVYLDPANMPQEIMISWSTNSSWEQRAYWGANKIDRGVNNTASRYYAGPLPAAGQWVRLEVAASAVGLEGKTITAMNFGLFDGRATFDASGKAPAGTTPTTTAPSTTTPSTTTPTTSSGGTETVWFDDALPAGAGGMGGTWNWVTSNPAPLSGTAAHQTALQAGHHSHWFGWSNNNLAVPAGDKLFAYVYLDPANVPSEIMIAWSTDSSWEHRAYWGANKIGVGTDGTASRYYAGPLPAAGQWVRLEVPASAVGMEGQTATAMNFMLYDGRATFDKTGRLTGSTSTSTATPTTSTPTTSTDTSSTTTPPTASAPATTTTYADTIWFDDALPAGAGGIGGNWNWVTSNPTPISGSAAHQSLVMSGDHSHWFGWSNANLPVAAGDKLFAYVYLDPANLPSEVMIAWSTNSSWEHRAYWGANKTDRGVNGTASRYYAGPLPAAGQWVRLEVPASAVAMEGETATAMNFILVDGRATFDKTGKSTPTTTTTTTTTTTPTTPTTTTPTTTTPTTSPAPTVSSDVVWFDDALPLGAQGGAKGGDTWLWVNNSPAPYSGTVSHQSGIKRGQHEHFFNLASQTLPVAVGDKLFVYVYLDPANVPSELMVSFCTNTWDHRAYWGANKINEGGEGTPGRYYAGPLPETGKWVRLEVPAKAVNVEGQAINGMGFALYDGRASWDIVGKTSASSTTSSTTTPTAPSTTTPTTTTPTTTTPTVTSTDTIWIDDALPAGAGGIGAKDGDSWNWVSSPVYSGSKAHQSAAVAGHHEHWFGWSNNNLTVAAGDKLFTYVYIDPANKPQEIMISWSTNSSWDQRAYWGANKIDRGTNGTASRYYAGALPEAGKWVRLEVPASAVGLEGKTVTAMNYSLFDGRVTWDASGKSSASSSSTTTPTTTTPTTTTPTTTTPTEPIATTPTTTTPTTPTTTTPTTPVISENLAFITPAAGSNALRVLSPTVLELQRITTKALNASVDVWNFVDSSGNLNAPAASAFTVKVGGNTVSVTSVGFKRRAIYAPLESRDLRIDNCLYLTLASAIPEGAAVEVTNPSATLWPTTMKFATTTHPLRNSPAIHVNQEGYSTGLPKKAMIGYYLGNRGELDLDVNAGFKLVNAATGATVHTGTLTARKDVGYQYSPMPYQKVLQADFSSVTTPGEYQLVVPGLGASLPFVIDDGVAIGFARTYALGIYHQRCGTDNALPFTRFAHAACHIAQAEVPNSTDASFDFTWRTVAAKTSENPNPRQTAPRITGESSMLYPFVNKGKIDVAGGHHDAGDYSKYTINVAALAHNLMFTVDAIQGAAALDNLGIPQSGDGISDILQEAKQETDFLAKMQDADGGFYFLVYPKTREYEDSLPEHGEPQVVWPKTTSVTAASVAALAQAASSPKFKAAYPAEAAAYLAKAKLGWQFLMNAIARHGKDGAYQKITHYGDQWMHDDELAWAAAEMFAATGEAQYQQKLKEWFPNPADTSTFRNTWARLSDGWGCAIRSYAFAARSGRLSAGQLDAAYLAACENQVKLAGEDMLRWSKESAYGSSFPDHSKRYMAAGWYFSLDQAADMAAAYQLDPKADYIDAVVANMNYEAGSNPVNVSYLAGVGLKRQTQMVNQFASHDHRRLPPIGIPAGNIGTEFQYGLPGYSNGEFAALSYPVDTKGAANVTPLYDRFLDSWCVYNEFVTVNQSRSLTSVAFLAAQTSAKSSTWKPSTTAKVVVSGTATVGQPVTLSLDASGLNLAGARVTWEVRDAMPSFGSTLVVTPKAPGAHWVEAEISWADGRRVFATGTFNVQ